MTPTIPNADGEYAYPPHVISRHHRARHLKIEAGIVMQAVARTRKISRWFHRDSRLADAREVAVNFPAPDERCEYFDLLDLAQGYGQHDTDSRGVLHVLLARKLRMDNDRSHRRERNFLVDAVERGDGDVNCFSAGCLYVHAEISCRRRQLDPFTRLLRLAAAAPSTTRASSKEKAQSSS